MKKHKQASRAGQVQQAFLLVLGVVLGTLWGYWLQAHAGTATTVRLRLLGLTHQQQQQQTRSSRPAAADQTSPINALVEGDGLGRLAVDPRRIDTQQPKAARSSCWWCVKPEWRQHFIFANTTGGVLEACPSDSSSWRPGLWTGQISSSTEIAGPSSSSSSSRDWQRHARPAAAGEAAVLPGTLAAQQAIWRAQNPPDCSKAKFIIFTSGYSGIGSMLHSQAAAMSAALETGRVFLESPGHFLTASSYCGSNNTLDSCYFLPLSNCTLSAAGVSAQELAAAPTFSAANMAALAAAHPDSPRVIRMGSQQAGAMRAFVPAMFQQQLEEAGVRADRRYWWWRAQAIAYMLRPNERTRAEIVKRKAAKLKGRDLEAGCISLYVRHGDKQSEARVWDDAAYEAALMQLRDIDSSLTRQVFLSTEDPQTVEYFTAKGSNWSTTYVDMKRKPDRGKSNLEYISEHGVSEEMLDCLLNLDLALSCDGFVASFYSNWSRLIEELRATVRCKAHRVFLDVGVELMRDERFGGLDLNWR